MSTFNHNDKFFVTSGGNIGVGIEAPNQDFHIKRDGSAPVIHLERINSNAGYLLLNGSINPSIAFDDGQNFRIATVSNSNFDGFSAKFTVKNDGNIGIGTDNPTYKLQVQGSGYFNETLYVNGDTEINAKLLITDEHVVHKSSSPEFYFHTSGNHYNWMIAAQENVDGGLEFGHSSATATSLDTTASNYTRTLTLKSDNTSEFGGNVTINGGAGNTLLLKKGSGTAAVTFAGTATDPQASALIEGIAGGGLKIYTGGSSGTISNPGWVAKMTMIQNGTTTFANAIIGENDNTTYGIIRSAKNIVSNSTYNLISMHSTRTVDDYGGLNKNYMQLNLVTPGPNTDGGSSAHGYGAFSLKLANNASSTSMSEVLNIAAGGTATFLNNVDATNFRSKANSSYSFTPNTSNKWQLNTPSGYIQFGPANGSYGHIETDRAQFYFNKKLVVDSGQIFSYDEDLLLARANSNATINLGEDSNATADAHITMKVGTKKGLIMRNGSYYLTNYLHSVHTDATSPTHTTMYQWYTLKNPAGYSANGLASSFKVKIYTAGRHANGSCYAEYLVRCHNANHQATSGLGNTEVFQLFKSGRDDGYGGKTQEVTWYVRNNLSGWNNGEILFRVKRGNREPVDTIKIEPIGADTSTDWMPTLVEHGAATAADGTRPTSDVQEITMQYAGLQRTGTSDARLIIDADGAANGTAHEISRFVNTSTGATSSYFYIGSTSGTDWRLGKNILGASGGSNFEIATHSGTTKALEINSSSLAATFAGVINANGGINVTGNIDTPNISINDYVKHNGNADAFFGFPAVNNFSIGTGGTERVRVDNAGKVGIGVNNPWTNLVIAGSGSSTSIGNDASYRLCLINTDQTNNNHSMISFSDGATQGGSAAMGCQYIDHTNNYGELVFATRDSGGFAERMRITSAGSVGIGVNNPGDFNSEANNLVIGTGSGAEGMTIYGGTDGGSYIFFADGTSGSALYEGFLQYRHTERAMRFGVATGVKMTLDASGRLGLGTTNPTSSVHVHASGSGSNYIKFTNDTTGATSTDGLVVGISGSEEAFFLQQENTAMRFATNDTTRMTIANDGLVGIGTDNPLGKLHVYNTSETSDRDGTATMTTSGQDSIVLYGHGGFDTRTYGGITWMGGSRRRAMITAVAENNDTDFVGLAFYTRGTDGDGDFAESLRISHSGKVGIGTIAGIDNKLHVEEKTANTACYTTIEAASWDAGVQLKNGNGSWEILNDYTGLGTTGTLAFYGHGAYRMVINNSGKVGIGSTTPSYRLQVYDATSDAPMMIESGDGFVGMKFKDPDANDNLYYRGDTESFYFTGNRLGVNNSNPVNNLSVYQGDSGSSYAQFINTTTGSTAGDGFVVGINTAESALVWNQENTALIFATNNTERMRISSGGKVGVGTNSPDTKLTVVVSGTNSIVKLDNLDTNYTITQYNAQGVTKGFSGFNTSFMLFGGESGTDTRLQAGGQYGLTIRNSDRNVGIGTTDPQSKLHVSGANTVGRFVSSTSYVDLIFTNSGGTGGFLNFVNNTTFNLYVGGGSGSDLKMSVTNGGLLTVTGDVVAFGSPSDASLKENVKPIDNALDKVTKLKGVTFDWKQSDSILDIKEDIGFIAQDVRGVLPELVRTNKDGKLSLRDKGIVPVLVEAIKELKAEIEELKCKCDGCTK